jgi:hypothetical protein
MNIYVFKYRTATGGGSDICGLKIKFGTNLMRGCPDKEHLLAQASALIIEDDFGPEPPNLMRNLYVKF